MYLVTTNHAGKFATRVGFAVDWVAGDTKLVSEEMLPFYRAHPNVFTVTKVTSTGVEVNHLDGSTTAGELLLSGADAVEQLAILGITAAPADINKITSIGGAALAGEAAGERVEKSRQTFANAGTAAADVTVAVVFATAFAAAPIVSLGAETALGAYISTAATTTGVSVTVPSVPAATTVYVNVIVAG